MGLLSKLSSKVSSTLDSKMDSMMGSEMGSKISSTVMGSEMGSKWASAVGFTFTQPNGETRTVAGYHAPTHSDSDVDNWVPSGNLTHIPHKVDLRPFMTAVEHQGSTNSCVANATAGAYEYLVKRHLGSDGYDVSRLFIYYNARGMDTEGITLLREDNGSFTRYAIAGLKKYGACSEETWPFDETQVTTEPSDEGYTEGVRFTIQDAFKLETDLNVWKTALAEGHPIIFSCNLYSSFGQGRRGKVPMPNKNEASASSHGQHAMLCVGYSDHDSVFIIRNSWGAEWGDEGYCYMPYNYLMSPNYNLHDSWIIERADVLPAAEETWAEDDETILQEASGFISQMSEEDYENLVAQMGSVPLEVRMSLIFLHTANADGELHDEELRAIAGYLHPVLEELGSHENAYTVLQNAKDKFMHDHDLLWASIGVFKNVFSHEVLAHITSQLQYVIGADGDIHEKEQEFVMYIVGQWQVGDDDEGEEEGEEEAAEEEEVEEEAEEEEEEEEQEEEEYDQDQYAHEGDEHHY